MPRNYNQDPGSRTATTGKAYEPAVTPNRRADDDTSVLGDRNDGEDREVFGQFGKESDRPAKAAATPRTEAERAHDDETRYEEDDRKTKH